jgi:hypothetical protein
MVMRMINRSITGPGRGTLFLERFYEVPWFCCRMPVMSATISLPS